MGQTPLALTGSVKQMLGEEVLAMPVGVAEQLLNTFSQVEIVSAALCSEQESRCKPLGTVRNL